MSIAGPKPQRVGSNGRGLRSPTAAAAMLAFALAILIAGLLLLILRSHEEARRNELALRHISRLAFAEMQRTGPPTALLPLKGGIHRDTDAGPVLLTRSIPATPPPVAALSVPPAVPFRVAYALVLGGFGLITGIATFLCWRRARVEPALRASVAHQQLLLNELNHRVRNNLQFVASLLLLQGRQAGNREARRLFSEVSGQVASAARVYDRLYQAGCAREIEFAGYLSDLCDDLSRALSTPQRRLSVEVRAEPMVLPATTAVSLAMAVNELVTNAGKHAYGNTPEALVEVAFGPDGDGVELTVADTGKGPAAANLPDRQGEGMRLLMTLVGEFGGSIEISDRQPGTLARLRLPTATAALA